MADAAVELPPTKLAYRPAEACEATGYSKSTLYRLLGSGKIRAKKSGGVTLILRDELQRHLDSLEDAE